MERRYDRGSFDEAASIPGHERIRMISSDVVSAISATDSTTQKVWDIYRSFRKVVIPWSRVGLQGYMNARSLRSGYGG